MKKLFSMASVLLLSLAVTSCGKKQEQKVEDPIVDVCVVKDVDGANMQTFTGKTKSSSDVNLAFRVSGQIMRVLVNEGAYVRKGQIVAEMDSRDYQVQLNATQAEYEQIKADAERVMALFAEGSTTASNNDKARYGLQQITQKLQNHKNQLADTKLRSTIDGYVQTKYHESGETVSAGMPILNVFGSGNTEVEIKISASDYADIEKYTSFYCKFDITGDEEFPLTISRKSQEANSNQLYPVRLRLPNNLTKKITPGMTTIVYAEKGQGSGTGVVSVPSTAVFNKNDKTQVFVFDEKSSTVHARPVNVVALHRDGSCEIDDGLKVGESIVCSGVHYVNDGQKVKRMQKPSNSNVGRLL